MPKTGLIERFDIDDANTRFCGYVRGIFENVPYKDASFLLSVMNSINSVGFQLFVADWPIKIYIRPVWDNFGEWKQIY